MLMFEAQRPSKCEHGETLCCLPEPCRPVEANDIALPLASRSPLPLLKTLALEEKIRVAYPPLVAATSRVTFHSSPSLPRSSRAAFSGSGGGMYYVPR